MTFSAARKQPIVQRTPFGWTIIKFDVTSSVAYDYRIADASGAEISTPQLNTWTSHAAGTSVIAKPMPTGGPYRLKLRETANHAVTALSPTGTSVGDITHFLGHSIANYMMAVYTDVAMPTAYSNTFMLTAETWVPPSGHGMIGYLNRMWELTGVPQAGCNSTFGGIALTVDSYMAALMAGAPLHGAYLVEGANEDPWQQFLNDVAVTYGGFACVISDLDYHDRRIKRDVFFRGRVELWDRVTKVAVAAQTDQPWGPWKPPQLTIGCVRPFATQADLSELRIGHEMFVSRTAGAFEIDRDNIALPDLYHPDGAGQIEYGTRIAEAYAEHAHGVV